MSIENKSSSLQLRYKINDAVFYWDSMNDKVCYGRIIGIGYEVCDTFNFVNYIVRDVYKDKDDDEYQMEITIDSIFENEEDIYLFLRERSYERNSCDLICSMSQEDFNKDFDKKYGYEPFDAYACLDKLTIRKSNEN